MASSTTYAPIGGADAGPIESPQHSSQGSSTSPNRRYTPDLESDEDDEPYVLAGTREGEVYELEELGAGKKNKRVRPIHGVDGQDDDSDLDDEHAMWVDRATTRRSSAQSFELYTPDEERAVRRKLDTHLVLFVALLYLLSFLDRVRTIRMVISFQIQRANVVIV